MKQPEDFRKAAVKYYILRWDIRNCTFCDADIGFIFSSDKNKVDFNNGCYCGVGSGLNLRESSWNEVADHYNRQTDKQVIKEMDLFWRFCPKPNLLNPKKK